MLSREDRSWATGVFVVREAALAEMTRSVWPAEGVGRTVIDSRVVGVRSAAGSLSVRVAEATCGVEIELDERLDATATVRSTGRDWTTVWRGCAAGAGALGAVMRVCVCRDADDPLFDETAGAERVSARATGACGRDSVRTAGADERLVVLTGADDGRSARVMVVGAERAAG